MKIAFVVSFFDFRNDVRRVIAEVAKQHEVVVLGRPEHAESIQAHLPEGAEFRLIIERQGTLWNKIWERLYLLFKQIPKSENNYYLMQLFHASNANTVTQRNKALCILNWTRILPKLISYDAYLDKLGFSGRTHIHDLNQFIFYTSIADDYLLARLLKEKHSVKVYVYSWDHACKNPKFSRRVKYMCWSEAIRDDVAELQGIAHDRIRAVGASQFSYIYEFLSGKKTRRSPYPYDYIYFGCAVGIPELAREEVKIIERLAQAVNQHAPSLKLVVRPYPIMKDWALYDTVRNLSNVVFDEDFRSFDLSVSERAIFEKFEKIHFAKAFLHLGTTMGLEACFTETPSFILDFGYETTQGLSLYNFIHQYQNDKYLIGISASNTVKSIHHLIMILTNLNSHAYLESNRKVALSFQPLHPFPELAASIIADV